MPVMPPSSHPSQTCGLSLLLCKPAYWMEPLECSVHPQIGLHRWLSGGEPACQCRRLKRLGFDLWVGKIPWRREWQPISIFLPGEFHGLRSLMGYNPWGRNESDRIEWLNMHSPTEVFVVVHFPPRSLEEKDRRREAGMWGGGVGHGSDHLYLGKYANQMKGEWRKLVKRKVAKIWEKLRFWEGRGEWLKGRRKVQIQILAGAREICWCHPC